MWATVAFYNEILLYHSIFLHGFSLRNRGEIRKSYYKINKTTVPKRKLICPRLYRALDRSKPSDLQLVVAHPGGMGERAEHGAVWFEARSPALNTALLPLCGLAQILFPISRSLIFLANNVFLLRQSLSEQKYSCTAFLLFPCGRKYVMKTEIYSVKCEFLHIVH